MYIIGCNNCIKNTIRTTTFCLVFYSRDTLSLVLLLLHVCIGNKADRGPERDRVSKLRVNAENVASVAPMLL